MNEAAVDSRLRMAAFMVVSSVPFVGPVPGAVVSQQAKAAAELAKGMFHSGMGQGR